MKLSIRTKFKRLVNIAKVENEVLKTFQEEVKKGVVERSPVDTFRPRSFTPSTSVGEFRDGWRDQKIDEHIAEVTNKTQVGVFLQGTGLWGSGQPIRARQFTGMFGNTYKLRRLGPFQWRADGDRWHHPLMVRGINPEAIAKEDGGIYNFYNEINEGIYKGVDEAMKKLDKSLERILRGND